jgi:hypothetical protein
VPFGPNSINKGSNAGRAFMQRHRSQPVHGPLFSALEQEHNVVLSASTSPMMRGEDLMVWEPEEDWVLNGYGGLGTESEVRRDQRRPALAIRAAPPSISNPLLVNEFCPGSLARTAVIASE